MQVLVRRVVSGGGLMVCRRVVIKLFIASAIRNQKLHRRQLRKYLE